MKLLALCLWSPRRAAKEIKASPRWLASFAILASAGVVLSILQHSRTVQLTLAHLPASATIGDKAVIEQSLHHELLVRSAFLPVRLMVGWASFALLLWYACKVWRSTEGARLYQVFSLEVAAEIVMVLGQCASLAGTPTTASFLRVPLGVDAFVSATADTVLLMTLNSFNAFSVWYIAILTAGISVLYGLTRIKSFLSVMATWITVQIFNASVLYILRESMHFKL